MPLPARHDDEERRRLADHAHDLCPCCGGRMEPIGSSRDRGRQTRRPGTTAHDRLPPALIADCYTRSVRTSPCRAAVAAPSRSSIVAGCSTSFSLACDRPSSVRLFVHPSPAPINGVRPRRLRIDRWAATAAFNPHSPPLARGLAQSGFNEIAHRAGGQDRAARSHRNLRIIT